MTSTIERESYARKAVQGFVQYSCAILSPGVEGRAALTNGSGTIIRTKGQNYCILTAKHIAEEAQGNQCRLGFYKAQNLIPDFVAGIILFPDDVDVGLLMVKSELTSPLEGLAVNQNIVPLNGQGELMTEDSLIVNGYPSMSTKFNVEKGVQGFELLTYWCVPENITFDEHQRYRLEWKDAVDSDNTDLDLPVPGGMSGGPLWRFRKPISASIWSASDIGRIVAVQSAWDKTDILFLEPVERWSNWFHESCTQIDKWFEENHGKALTRRCT